jgi:hypothetical protein
MGFEVEMCLAGLALTKQIIFEPSILKQVNKSGSVPQAVGVATVFGTEAFCETFGLLLVEVVICEDF